MFKLLKWAVLALLVILVLGGVIEIRVHPEAIVSLPQRIGELAGNAGAGESARAWVTEVKRSTEQWIVKDDHQKLTIAAGYITSDANRLLGLIAEEPGDPATILPQAELLLDSIERARDIISAADIDAIAEAREDAHAALSSAAGALNKLKELEAEQEALHERFQETTQALADRIGTIESESTEEESDTTSDADDSDVSESEEPTQSEADAAGIPLEF